MIYAIRSVLAAITASLILLISDQAIAQSSADFGQQAINAANRQVEIILTKFRPHFPPEHVDLLQAGKVRIVVAADFNAFADFGERRVKIPAQLVVETLLQAHALGVIHKDRSLVRHWEPWMRYLTERTAEAHARFASGRSLVDESPIDQFWSFAGLPRPPQQDARDSVVQEQLMHDALALVIAHELGHLALGHLPYSSISQTQSHRQEGDADRFSANLLRKSKIDVLPGLTMVFARFAMLEEVSRRPEIERMTHRRAMCRLYRMGRTELDQLRRNPDSRLSPYMDVNSFRSAMNELEEACTVR